VLAGEQWTDPIAGRRTLDGVLRRLAGADRVANVLMARETGKSDRQRPRKRDSLSTKEDRQT
jgi:hypothetical protein